METPESLSAYNLFTAYAQLWELIGKGYVIAGFIYDAPHWQIMKIKKVKNVYGIYVKGYGCGEGDNFEEFLQDCQVWNLHYIVPHNL